MLCVDGLANGIDREGFSIVEDVLPRQQVDELLLALEGIAEDAAVRRRGGVFAVRNLLDVSDDVRSLAGSTIVRELVEPVLGPKFIPVRGILFDKIPNANWKVPWHQDVTIAVQKRVDAEGFGPWSMKAEVLHVQPPAYVLEQMVSVRLHLDACGEENGALRVVPGSHRLGRISEKQIQSVREGLFERLCTVGVGGALVMRPLLLHASSPSSAPMHRRVIHLDFASVRLPDGMSWFTEAA